MTVENRLSGPLDDPAGEAGHVGHPPRVGFFTDTSVCIGCKACEVACKEWNLVPDDGFNLLGRSYDNSGGLSADTWRHVAFVEQKLPSPDTSHAGLDVLAMAAAGPQDPTAAGPDLTGGRPDFRWLMASDVCKHCTDAACLDVCPTGSLFRTEFGTVVVQQDICNGCGYCVSACPFGVIARREDDGRAWKCTLCYDRIGDGMTPACAKACPTESIQYGDVDELRERAHARLHQLQAAGVADAQLYGEDEGDGVGGFGAFFLLLDKPETYGLPPDPVASTRDLWSMWKHATVAALGLLGGVAAVFVKAGKR